jgi:glycosyltransferase involved in cell wall biosynthesis
LSIDHISVVIIAKDAEQHIKNCLDSITDFSEVILYLNNSKDKTEEIAQNYNNVSIIQGEFTGFGTTKKRATLYAKNDWILSLDSDESIISNLLTELKTLKLNNKKEVFIIKRDNYFLGKEVKYSGWGKDKLTRLYNKSYHQFNQNLVHEFVELKDDTIKINLKNSFRHDAVQDVNQFLQKIIKYSDLGAENKKTCNFLTVLLKANFAFFKTYIIQLGFLDGWRGYVIAISDFNGRFYRYTKRYINCKIK